MTNAVIVAVKGEVLHGGNPEPKLVAAKAEVLHGGNPTPKVVAMKMEVLHSLAAAAVANRRVVVVTGL